MQREVVAEHKVTERLENKVQDVSNYGRSEKRGEMIGFMH